MSDSAADLQDCLATIDEQRDTIRRLLLEKYEPIAIIGLGLRFPGGSDSPEEFERFLREGRSAIRPVPADRWDLATFAPASDSELGKIRMAGGGFLDQIDLFDAQFFNISPKEAPYVDPQQRMLLETAWHALEDANLDPTPLRRGNGGVYIGASSIDYALEIEAIPYDKLDGHLASGITLFPISGRLSYFLGWHGPSMTVDTACASSLTALHAAVSGLRRGECDIALCGAVNALHHPRTPVVFTHANMLAPDGQCKTFDESADGYVRAEGCGVLVLKRLADARRDGDRIVGLVRGTAVGQDGDSAGLTVPNGAAQSMVMRAALAAAILSPRDIQYVEAHGTGTALGDPIEMGAIADVFANSHSATDPIIVGSVKTNLGHMEPVAGIVGIVKVLLQMRGETIFPHLNFHQPSGRIPWDTYPVAVPTECRPWPAKTRRAIVNSFGFAGTIAAVVVEQPPAPAEVTDSDGQGPAEPGYVFALSAKSQGALRQQVDRMRQFVALRSDVSLADLCYTTHVGRAHFNFRTAGEIRDRADLLALLDREAARLQAEKIRPGDFRKAAFLFAGQGAQYPGMALPLYGHFPLFRELVDECDRLFAETLGRSVKELMLEPNNEAINQTGFAQPALFTLEYALAKLWLSWGVRPAVLIGHSIGEVAAAAVAGLFSLADAVRLVSARASLMQSVSAAGGMAAVSAEPDELAGLIADHPDLAIAAINAPGQVVISGGRASLAAVMAQLAGRGVPAQPLRVSHAFHSPLMAEVLEDFQAALRGIRFNEPTLTLVSNLTGQVARTADVADARYWVRHIAEPVKFDAGMRTIDERGRHVFVEIGPSATLSSLAKLCVSPDTHRFITCMHRKDTDATTIRRALAQAYTAGLAVSWPGLHRGRQRNKITLPTYAFERKRYWLPVADNRHGVGSRRSTGVMRNVLLGEPMAAVAGERRFTSTLSHDSPTYLTEHRCAGQIVVPTGVYLELLFAAQDEVYGQTTRPLRKIRMHRALVIADDQTVQIGTRLRPRTDGSTAVEVCTEPDGALLASAVIGPASRIRGLSAAGRRLLASATGATYPQAPSSGDEWYADQTSAGMESGPQFRRLVEILRHNGSALATLRGQPATAADFLPPVLLECAAQVGQLLTEDPSPRLAVSMTSARMLRKPKGDTLHVAGGRRQRGARLVADLVIMEGDEPIAELTGVSYGWPVGAPEVTPRHFLHHLTWIGQERAPRTAAPARHVVAVHPGPELTASRRGDLRVTTVDSAANAVATVTQSGDVTDVCWFWQSLAEPVGVDMLRRESRLNYEDLLTLVKGLSEADSGRHQRLWLVTRRSQWLAGDVAGSGECLAAMSLWGFGRVLFNEYPTLRVTLVDVACEDSDLAALLDEIQFGDAGEYQLAFRDGVRSVPRLRPGASANSGEVGGPLSIDAGLTYLITGGLGALGLATAGKLVDLGARHIALVSRRGVPAHDATELWQRLRRDARVSLYRVDLADPADMARLVEELNSRSRPVGGIIHAAGLLDDKPVSAQSWPTIDALFAAKVYGTWLLHEAARSFPKLTFFVGFSSAAAVLGGAGQSNYAAANAFLDGFIHWRARQGLPGLSINWGPWSQAGMSARLSAQHVRALEAEGIRYFSPARALRTMSSLLAQPVTQVGVGECDWDRFVASKPLPNPVLSELSSPEASTTLDLDHLLDASGSERTSAVEQFVRHKLARVLHIDDLDAIEADVEFVDLGLDSLMAVELTNGLEAAFRLSLPASAPFDHPCVEQLTEFLLGQLRAVHR